MAKVIDGGFSLYAFTFFLPIYSELSLLIQERFVLLFFRMGTGFFIFLFDVPRVDKNGTFSLSLSHSVSDCICTVVYRASQNWTYLDLALDL